MSALSNPSNPTSDFYGNAERPAAKVKRRTGLLRTLTLITIVSFVIVTYMVLFVAGQDALQGDVQRLFYFHMPSFFGAFVAFSATVVGGIQYLRTRNIKWDALAVAGVEVGLAMSIITLVTGSIWARPIWNTWWTWDPRLTSAAVMGLTYAAYLMLRSGIENPESRRRFMSVYGILAISTVIFTLVVIRIRPDTIHPAVIGPSPANAEGGFEMAGSMGAALITNLVFWSLLLTPLLMWWRIRLENAIEHVNQRKAEYMER